MHWEKRLVSTDRGVFEVFQFGAGMPVCVAHNYSEFNHTGDAFAESFAQDHHVILVNLREAGNSAKAIEPYQLSMIEAVVDLEAIRTELGFDQWTFAGHSTGGMIGLLYGIYFPRSLSSLILAGTAAREYTSSSERCIYNVNHPQNALMNKLMALLKSPTLTETDRKSLAQQRTQLSLYHPEKYADYFSAGIQKKMSAIRLDFFNRELSIYDITRQLEKITAPALILCGRHDVQCPVDFSIEMSEYIPNNKLVIFEDSNHYPFLEEAELFKEVTRHFLEESLLTGSINLEGR